MPPVFDEVIAKGVKILWFQEGATDAEAAEKAKKAGIEVVEDKFMRDMRRSSIAGKA